MLEYRYKYFDVSQNGDVTIVQFKDPNIYDQLLVNELNDELISLIERDIPPKLLILFDRVTYCSSEVLAGLIRARKRILASGGKIRLAGMLPRIRQMFQISKLEKIFDIDDTENQAITALSST